MPQGLTREQMAQRTARELQDGFYVNLGFGLPQLVANYLPSAVQVFLHSENGILGYGRAALPDEEDRDIIDAGGVCVTERPGTAYFDSALSFGMIRGGHVDVAVLGGLQVSERGDLANWLVPSRKVGNIGGAMDLVTGARRVIVLMEHVTKEGELRILHECNYPLTGRAVVHRVITNLAVIDVAHDGLVLREVAPGITPDDVQGLTEPKLAIAHDVAEMAVS